MAIPAGLTSYMVTALCSVVAPTVLGLGVCRTIGLGTAEGWRTSLAYAYLIGHFGIAHLTALWLFASQPVSGVWLPIVAGLTGIALLVRARARQEVQPGPRPQHASPWIWLPLAVLVLVSLHDFLRTNFDPIRLSDEAQIWAAKAKVLFAASHFDPGHGLRGFVQHPDYPMFDPLVQVLAFAGAGRVLHFENRLPIQCFGIALLMLLSAATTRRAHPIVATLVLIVFAGTSFANETTSVYADVMLGTAALATVDALLRLRETGARVWWRIACIGVGAMLATKNEGALLSLAVLAPFALRWWLDRRQAPTPPRVPWAESLWLLVPAVTIGAHMAFNRHFDLTNNLIATGGGHGLFGRMLAQAGTHGPAVLAYYAELLVQPGAHRLLPLLLLATCLPRLFVGRELLRDSPSAMLALVVVATVGGYMLVFVGTNSELQWHLSTAAARTMQHVVPIAALGLCMAVWPRRDVERSRVDQGRQAANARAT